MTLLADERVEDLVAVCIVNGVEVTGREVQATGFAARKGSVRLTVLEGRAPSEVGEVALGSRTMRAIGAGIGEVLEVGGDATQGLRPVGVTLFPIVDDPEHAHGAALILEGLDVLGRRRLLGHPRAVGAGQDVIAGRQQLDERVGFVFGIAAPAEVATSPHSSGLPGGDRRRPRRARHGHAGPCRAHLGPPPHGAGRAEGRWPGAITGGSHSRGPRRDRHRRRPRRRPACRPPGWAHGVAGDRHRH